MGILKPCYSYQHYYLSIYRKFLVCRNFSIFLISLFELFLLLCYGCVNGVESPLNC